MDDAPRKKSQSTAAFLRGKVGRMPFGALVFSQWEALIVWVFGGLPGFPGIALRSLAYRMIFRRMGGFAWIQPRVMFVQADRLSVGEKFGVNSGTYINAIGGITIGDHVLIGSNVTLSSGRHPIEGEKPPIFARRAQPLPIEIGDDVWIGAGAVIMPGVTLATGTVVGANAVVTRSTEAYSVMAGVPARKIRSRIPGP